MCSGFCAFWLINLTEETESTFIPKVSALLLFESSISYGRGYLPEVLRQIRSYLQEVLRQIRSYLPEVLRQISSYLPEVLRQIRSYLPEYLRQMRPYLPEPFLSYTVLNGPVQSYLLLCYTVRYYTVCKVFILLYYGRMMIFDMYAYLRLRNWPPPRWQPKTPH